MTTLPRPLLRPVDGTSTIQPQPLDPRIPVSLCLWLDIKSFETTLVGATNDSQGNGNSSGSNALIRVDESHTFSILLHHFFFNVANSSVLPLVMQSLALQDAQASTLLSGLCIVIAQACMSSFAKLCGDYSPHWGRKSIMLVGLASLILQCFLPTFLVPAEAHTTTTRGSHVLKALILSTQFLDSVGAGILGTLQILVRGHRTFSLIMGVTTGAMCLGATVSSYVGQLIAYEYDYSAAFTSLGLVSLIPFGLYVFLMPETLPEYARPPPQKRRRRLRELLQPLNEPRRHVLQSKSSPFRQRESIESPASEALHRVTAPESLGYSKKRVELA